MQGLAQQDDRADDPQRQPDPGQDEARSGRQTLKLRGQNFAAAPAHHRPGIDQCKQTHPRPQLAGEIRHFRPISRSRSRR